MGVTDEKKDDDGDEQYNLDGRTRK
jgi:hypothetical protein